MPESVVANVVVDTVGIEPTASIVSGWRSTTEPCVRKPATFRTVAGCLDCVAGLEPAASL